MNISVCIATYRRPDRLRALLGDLLLQQRLPQEVIVVDNDALRSAQIVVDELCAAGELPFVLRYAVEARKNIAVSRNTSVALAGGDWLAFIDDDERAPVHWLDTLAISAQRFAADGVLGPVQPLLPASAPAWLHRGQFYHWPRMKTGGIVPPNRLRFGNVMLRAATLRTQSPVFDPAYGLTGGEDGDLLARLALGGAQLIWCDEALVNEPVEPARQSLRWLLLRSMRGGQDFARHKLAGRYGPVGSARRARLLGRALMQMMLAGLLALLCLPIGFHLAAHWLTKAAANLGKLSAFAGWHYREYA